MNRELDGINNLKISPLQYQQRNISFLPTIMTRISPFFPNSKHQIRDATITERIVVKNHWGEMNVTGKRLSIYDETVLLGLLVLLKKYDSNAFETTPNELCKLMDVKPTENTYQLNHEKSL